MKVIVKLHTRLRSAVGKDELDLSFTSSPNLVSLLEFLSKEYPKLEPLLKGESGYQHLMILINNSSIGPVIGDALEKKFKEGDIISIFEPSAAG